MKHIPVLYSSVVIVAIQLTLQSSIAAERSERAVTALLQQEGQEPVPQRTAVLQPVLEQSPDLAAARWLAGYVASGKDWVPFEQIATQAADDAALREYQRRRSTKELKAEDHLELASWCEKQRLRDQARAHLFAVVAEHPQRADLWQRLGYKLVDGRWMSAEEERELDQRWQQRDRDLKRWRPKAANLAKRLADPKPNVQGIARQQLKEIDDLSALPALEEALTTSTPELALEFVHWAKGIRCVETTMALARQAVVAPWEPIRATSTDSLRSRPLDDFVEPLLNTLSTPTETASYASPMAPYGMTLYALTFRREFRDRIEAATSLAINAGPKVQTISIARRSGRVSVQSETPPPLVALNQQRQANDAVRANESQRAQLDAQNAAIQELNGRISSCLAAVTGEPSTSTPGEWWNWWENWASRESAPVKPVFEVTEINPVKIGTVTQVKMVSCLPAGTPVFTELGPRPIESLKIGDRVLSKDIDSGELAFRPVLKTTVRSPQPLVKLHSAHESLQATRGHHFFVSGRGWVMARDLKSGDRFHGVHGTITLTDVSPGDTAAVYNLVVERANTYFVGNSLILSHDVTPPSPTNVKVPGLATR